MTPLVAGFFFYSVPVVLGLEAYRRQLVSWCLIFLSCFICLSDGASVLGSLGVHGDRSLRQIGLSDLGGGPRDPGGLLYRVEGRVVRTVLGRS